MRKMALTPLLCGLCSLLFGQVNPGSLPDLQIGLSGLAYYNSPYFANALLIEGRQWMKVGTYDHFEKNGLYDQNGYPKWLPDTTSQYPDGTPLYMNPGMNAGNEKNGLYRGKMTLTWEGDGDVRLNGSFVAEESNTSSGQGSYSNGKRIYIVGQNGIPNGVACTIYKINPANPPRNIKVWLPDPENPFAKSLAPDAGQAEPIFHPLFLKKMQDNNHFGIIRFMDFGETNVNPTVFWSERRKPSYVAQCGDNFPKRVVPGGSEQCVRGNSGVSYEYMIELCNLTNKDMWFCVPHGATDGFIDSLAMLIKGDDPDGTGCPGLNSNLKVFLEYSNEVWTPPSDQVRNGYFTQGAYAEDMKEAYNQANGTNITREAWIGRRFCEVWSIFCNRFGNDQRVVNVLATWTANVNQYTNKLIASATEYGPTLSPAVTPEVLAVTTYFGNDIQSYIFNNTDWQTGASAADLTKVFQEWELRILTEEANSTGKDYTGGGGGFGADIMNISRQYNIPLMAYEGGVSLNSDFSVWTLDCKIVPQTTPGATWYYMLGREAVRPCSGTGTETPWENFIRAVQRDSRYGDMLYLSTSLAKAKGMCTPSQFGDIGTAGSVYGMWGCWESFDQADEDAPKVVAWKKFYNDYKNLREVTDSVGSRPYFKNVGELAPAKVNANYQAVIETEGGDGSLTLEKLGSPKLPNGVSLRIANGKVYVEGMPQQDGIYRFALRVKDSDNDFSLGIYTLRVLPEPKNKLYAYEDFGSEAKPLFQRSGGLNFSGNWHVQGDDSAFAIKTGQAFSYDGLITSGSAFASIGSQYRSAGGALNVNQFEHLAASNNPSMIGQTGTTLWFSGLVKRNTNTQNDVFNFCNSVITENYGSHLISVGVNSGKWYLAVKKKDSQEQTRIMTNIQASTGSADLVVVSIDFEDPYDKVRLYINPDLTHSNAPATPDAEYQLTADDADILINAIGLYGSNASNQVEVDDLRFGDTFLAVTPRTSDPVEPEVPSKIYAYEDFGQTAMPLYQLPGGLNFSGNWHVQGDDAAFAVKTAAPFSYSGLETSGSAYAGIGSQYRTAGGALNVSQFEDLVSSSNSSMIGENGKTLWFSGLVRRNAGANNNNYIFYFNNTILAEIANSRLLGIGVNNEGKWCIGVKKNDSDEQTQTASNLTASTGVVDLVVVAIDFEAPYDKVRLYINPDLTSNNEPSTPTAEYRLTSADTDLLINTLGLYGSNASNQVEVDDLRFGNTFLAVTPRSNNALLYSRDNAVSNVGDSGINPIFVYPNPAADYLYLSGIDKYEQILLFDINGNRYSIDAIEWNRINISSLPKGNYLLQIITEEDNFSLRFEKK
ncbi:MAG: T9SS type A sorting domain-containing protein [Bacteroidales bacterium]|nr:T9SS type A sorting domain-containing protein [Bacteroidales bacterium]